MPVGGIIYPSHSNNICIYIFRIIFSTSTLQRIKRPARLSTWLFSLGPTPGTNAVRGKKHSNTTPPIGIDVLHLPTVVRPAPIVFKRIIQIPYLLEMP